MKNANAPAMPVLDEIGMPYDTIPEQNCTIGLSKREYFAAMAMQGLCSDPDMRAPETEVCLAVKIADTLLAELERTHESD